jgi:transcriptional regulator NrdR family protein
MKCVKCGSPTHVVLTYQNVDNTVKRRRECKNPKCLHRFTTREKIDVRQPNTQHTR